MTKKSGTEGVTLHLNILSLSIFIHHLSFSVSLSSVSFFHNPVPPATISIHNHHIHPPSPKPQTTTKIIKIIIVIIIIINHIQNYKIKESSKSKNHKITIKTQNHPDQPTRSTPINPWTQPPKSRTHQNQSKPLKLELTDIKSQNPLTKPPQRPTMNHLETHDPRKTTAAQPHLASHPDHTQDPWTRDVERKGNREVERKWKKE